MKHIISAYNFSRDELEDIFALTDKYSKNLNDTRKILSGKTISIAFFEPSTRTYLSFQKAIINLGGDVIGFSGEESTSVAKGENLADTIRMLNNYSDGIVMRHKYDGASRFASEISDIPVINAGDGKHEHPTQAVIDIYTINKHFNTIDGLVFALLGDLKYARTVNSLLRILTRFRPKLVYLISPQLLRARKEILDELNYPVKEVENPFEVINEVDVLYVTRIQKERFVDEMEYEKIKGSYIVSLDLANKMKKDSIILHPLPRVNEIDRKVDKTTKAKYFEQASYGVPVRMSILTKIYGE
ncbi:aspartate carbamoyltransferase [Sulfolobus acidocaldarius]|uniref:Aspartate carbamoyltransferase catalytic subunit n=4 Tax=Sulfolobus acidocaldarius TaxID=2285 RepID=PYRB_SULAC|nr:aspartate carbamoyltransferase [Sulfolobus acidocaldarius]Q55338.1 RecName: Full=Aspartate carbamoyltransferase catalytic subunit; AltName: Full=Aspartate transcarbamylase; Short=ATCase [Sulfolobus acidocaldarius DSM 639]AAY80909.1 aspartate carbamoyltransferase [Sulfolobus acidocaldarius DSM 639]AGE71509.1 aspartate carbamoyltransferase catalytic subunit [Sulfolobus acidocaldarius N8]AGE73782.1 aspartate carbamoyltransferase catalytic subunit [Sulfolobus acidocaldarius Ron12/I]ALU30259.1 a